MHCTLGFDERGSIVMHSIHLKINFQRLSANFPSSVWGQLNWKTCPGLTIRLWHSNAQTVIVNLI